MLLNKKSVYYKYLNIMVIILDKELYWVNFKERKKFTVVNERRKTIWLLFCSYDPFTY